MGAIPPPPRFARGCRDRLVRVNGAHGWKAAGWASKAGCGFRGRLTPWLGAACLREGGRGRVWERGSPVDFCGDGGVELGGRPATTPSREVWGEGGPLQPSSALAGVEGPQTRPGHPEEDGHPAESPPPGRPLLPSGAGSRLSSEPLITGSGGERGALPPPRPHPTRTSGVPLCVAWTLSRATLVGSQRKKVAGEAAGGIPRGAAWAGKDQG